MKALKAFIKPSEAPKGSVKIKILIQLSEMDGAIKNWILPLLKKFLFRNLLLFPFTYVGSTGVASSLVWSNP